MAAEIHSRAVGPQGIHAHDPGPPNLSVPPPWPPSPQATLSPALPCPPHGILPLLPGGCWVLPFGSLGGIRGNMIAYSEHINDCMTPWMDPSSPGAQDWPFSLPPFPMPPPITGSPCPLSPWIRNMHGGSTTPPHAQTTLPPVNSRCPTPLQGAAPSPLGNLIPHPPPPVPLPCWTPHSRPIPDLCPKAFCSSWWPGLSVPSQEGRSRVPVGQPLHLPAIRTLCSCSCSGRAFVSDVSASSLPTQDCVQSRHGTVSQGTGIRE